MIQWKEEPMSHVDDGELTAYADGAWPANDPEALRIGAHLSTCDNCRARLELAHALRDRAAEVLGYATPAAVPTPSFESLQAKIATSSRRPRRTIPLAWAATIIMALGLGWFGRGFWQNAPQMADVAVRETPVVTQSEAAEENTMTAEPSAAATGSASASRPAPAPAPAAPTAPPQVAANAARRERAPERAAAEQDMAADRSGFIAGRAAGAATQAAAPPSAEALAVTAESTARTITPAEAERRGMDIPRIPDLPIARIVLNGDTTAVVQSLPDGRLVTLTVTPEVEVRARQRDAAAAEVAAPMAPQAAKAVAAPPIVTRVRGKLVRVQGELPADSLRSLSLKVR
jgi:hypothetical protein